jgi:hypothetical protein
MTGFDSKRQMAQDKEALKLALDALKGVLDDDPKVLEASISGGLYEVVQCRDAITAIKEALAQPAQEPERPWVGLTDEELTLCESEEDVRFVRAIEAVLRSKNT